LLKYLYGVHERHPRQLSQRLLQKFSRLILTRMRMKGIEFIPLAT
jgi:hypothetical protein